MTVTTEAVSRPPWSRLGARTGRGRTGGKPAPWAWAAPAILLLLTIHYLAIAAGAWYAFTDWSGASPRASFIGLANFRHILQDHTARTALTNTLELTVCFVVAVNVLGLLLALGTRRTLKTRNLIRSLFFAPAVLSPLAVSYIWQFIFDYNGPLNFILRMAGMGSQQRAWLGSPSWALWTVLVVLVWQFAGLAMIFYLAGLQSIPDELEEASAVDGATPFYHFRRVTLPLLAPALTVSFTFTLLLGLRIFDQIIALTGGGPVNATETLATQVYKQTWVYGRFGYGAALALVLSLLVAILAFAQLAVLRLRERGG
ncbi:MAG TPA: sugar ABC transporter permease [Candidatus Dormibacteraeota bacterium]|nr:sugar ABC transporter permease [Candidatus Dormibacteraeota bacterium]